MATYALISGGLVVNLIDLEPEADWQPPPDHIVVPAPEQGCRIGDAYDGEGSFSSPSPVLPAISDRQFFQALATPPFSLITPAEALAAVKMGELPAALAAILDGIESDADRFAAEMLLSGATVFERAHPMLVEIADAFWTFAAGL